RYAWIRSETSRDPATRPTNTRAYLRAKPRRRAPEAPPSVPSLPGVLGQAIRRLRAPVNRVTAPSARDRLRIRRSASAGPACGRRALARTARDSSSRAPGGRPFAPSAPRMPGGSVRLREACRVLSTGSGAPDRSSRTFHFLPQCSFDGRSIWRGGLQRDAAHHRQAVSFDTGPLTLSDPGLIVGR